MDVDRCLPTREGSSLICFSGGASRTVHPLMVSEGRAAAEGLPTFSAFVGLLSSVDDGVPNEICAPTEGLPTLNTFVGFLPAMNALVPCKS